MREMLDRCVSRIHCQAHPVCEEDVILESRVELYSGLRGKGRIGDGNEIS